MRRTALGVLLGLAACGGGGGGGGSADGGGGGADAGGLRGDLHIVHGPSPTAPSTARLGPGALPAPTDGHWVLTPDGGKAQLVSLSFVTSEGASITAPLPEACAPTYDRGDAALARILDCPFSLPHGTYTGFGVNMSSTFQVLVDDATNGFYTDPAAETLLSTTPTTADYVTVDLSSTLGPTIGLNYQLAQPLYVTSEEPAAITLLVDMIHTTQVEVSGGVASFRHDGVWAPMLLFGVPEDVGQAAYYSSLGTTESYNYSNPPVDAQSLRLYYQGQAPIAAFLSPTTIAGTGTVAAYAVAPADAPPSDGGTSAGGFLGRDADGTICWAAASDYTWGTYTSVFEMPEAAAIGDAVTLTRDDTADPSAPASGTYAGGCPAVTADATASLTLTAD